MKNLDFWPNPCKINLSNYLECKLKSYGLIPHNSKHGSREVIFKYSDEIRVPIEYDTIALTRQPSAPYVEEEIPCEYHIELKIIPKTIGIDNEEFPEHLNYNYWVKSNEIAIWLDKILNEFFKDHIKANPDINEWKIKRWES